MRVLIFLWVIQGFAAYNLTWGTPAANLDSNPPAGDTDENVTIAMDVNGNAIASWGRTTGSHATGDIWASQYNHNQRVWSGTVKISGGGNAFNSKVAMDGKGNSIFVWEEGFPTQIMSRTLTQNGVWIPDLEKAPILISKSQYEQTSPQIAQDHLGNALAVWMETINGTSHIYSAKKENISSWQNLGKLSRGNGTLQGTKSLAMNGKGDAIAVWQERVDQDLEIHGSKFLNGKWQKECTIIAKKYTSFHSPAVAIDTQGNGVIVWSSNKEIYSKSWIRSTISTNPILISDPHFHASNPDIAVDEKGNALVVFERKDKLHKFITSASLPFNGASWSTPIDISAPSPVENQIAGFPVLSMNPIGDAVVIWKEFNGDKIVIQGAGYSLGTWSLHKTLSSLDHHSGSSLPTYDIAVAINTAGHIMAVWPEDSSMVGALQVKATSALTQLKGSSGVGLANFGPNPPLAAKETLEDGVSYGKQILHRFPAHSDLINIINWEASLNATQYNIYRGSLSNLIATSKINVYEDHRRVPKQKETYLITSVDVNGQESSPVTVVVHPR